MSDDDGWVWAQRTGSARYTGHNARGASVAMAREDVDGAFTPGELLGVALAGCAGLSADAALERRLGAQAALRIDVERTKHATDDRYDTLTETLTLALAALDEAERARLVEVITRSIDRTCTVGNTLKAGAAVTVHIEGAAQ